MIDKLQEYGQSLLNLDMASRTRLDSETYEGYFKQDLEKIRELLDELEHLPDEIGFKNENDICLLRAFIKEQLRRNKILAHSLDYAIELLKQNHICPQNVVCPSNDYKEFRNCNQCWSRELIYHGTKDAEEVPFTNEYKTK